MKTQYEIHRVSQYYAVTLVCESGEYHLGSDKRLAGAKAIAAADKGKRVRWTECGSLRSGWLEGK